MLWPLILPFQITIAAFAGLLLAATLAAPLVRLRRLAVFGWGVLLAGLAFVPSCTAVMEFVDQRRFGEFTYDDASQVNDWRVERYLPEAASEITLHKRFYGYRARFTIDKKTLDEWTLRRWKKFGPSSATQRAPDDGQQPASPAVFDDYFGEFEWHCPDDAVLYSGPTASNFAGYQIWFSESTGEAFQATGYW